MLKAIIRKLSQVRDDPVLRRWLVGRALGKLHGEPPYIAHRPPYLMNQLPLDFEQPAPTKEFRELAADAPNTNIDLPLPALTLRLQPGEEHDLFHRDFTDTETLLAVHRFSWLPLMGPQVEPSWVDAIWRIWLSAYQTPDDSWAWHPYTAAERAINILRFATTHGLPGQYEETLDCLAKHAPAIAGRLEYFGDHHTSNHLANNGRGLFLLGLWLGMPKAADLGGDILTTEASRIFHASGLLREGSSHYHLLLAKNYDEVACEAEVHYRGEASALRDIANRAIALAAMLVLPGGLPLIGDISPDCPPRYLLENLSLPKMPPPRQEYIDGWLRYDQGPWAGLWHVSPQGWRQMPGHGHEDCGGFELHFDDKPLFVDPGRGTYGGSDEFAQSAAAHNTILVDGQNPYPPNRPYYDDNFRSHICGNDPILQQTGAEIHVIHHGFSRLGGVGRVHRQWSFKNKSLVINDSIEGRGIHTITRSLVTPLEAEIENNAVILKSAGSFFRISAPGANLSLNPITRWFAYGFGEAVLRIHFETRASLSWNGTINVEKV